MAKLTEEQTQQYVLKLSKMDAEDLLREYEATSVRAAVTNIADPLWDQAQEAKALIREELTERLLHGGN